VEAACKHNKDNHGINNASFRHFHIHTSSINARFTGFMGDASSQFRMALPPLRGILLSLTVQTGGFVESFIGMKVFQKITKN
jgi:hypothetical protein